MGASFAGLGTESAEIYQSSRTSRSMLYREKLCGGRVAGEENQQSRGCRAAKKRAAQIPYWHSSALRPSSTARAHQKAGARAVEQQLITDVDAPTGIG